MFERFTDQARRVVVLAQEEAMQLNHDYIGTEHILLGLIHQEKGTAAVAINSLGVSLEDVRGKVHDIIGYGSSQPIPHIPFTPRAKRVLELALRESLRLAHRDINTEHILLGLIRESEGVAVQIIIQLGCELSDIRQRVLELLAMHELTSDSMLTGLTRVGDIDSLKRRLRSVEFLIEAKQKEREMLVEAIQKFERTGPET